MTLYLFPPIKSSELRNFVKANLKQPFCGFAFELRVVVLSLTSKVLDLGVNFLFEGGDLSWCAGKVRHWFVRLFVFKPLLLNLELSILVVFKENAPVLWLGGGLLPFSLIGLLLRFLGEVYFTSIRGRNWYQGSNRHPANLN
jgi:hypothetical protein